MTHCSRGLVPRPCPRLGNTRRHPHCSSPHYDDQVEAWFCGAYHPMLYDRKDVEREAMDRLCLLPLT